jgi:hypothetical protein
MLRNIKTKPAQAIISVIIINFQLKIQWNLN